MTTKLWHDDIRKPPSENWAWARTNEDAKDLLFQFEIEHISLDNDLGLDNLDPDKPGAYNLRGTSPNGEGIELLDWMIAFNCVPPKVSIHSMNVVRANTMIKTLTNAVDRGLVGSVKFYHIPFLVPNTPNGIQELHNIYENL